MKDTVIERNSKSTRKLLLDLWGHLSSRRRIQMGVLLIVMSISAGAELISLGAVIPFLAILSEPDILWEQPFVQNFAVRAGFSQPNDLILPVTIIFITAAVAAMLIRVANLWINAHLAGAVGSDLGCEVYERSLNQSYHSYIQSNSAELISANTIKISGAMQSVKSLLQLITSLFVSFGILMALVLYDWTVAFGSIVLFGISYLLLSVCVQKELSRNSKSISKAADLQVKALQEGIGAFREIFLDGNQEFYIDVYRKIERPQKYLQATNQFLATFPRHVVEVLGLIAIALLGSWLVIQDGSVQAVIPTLGVFALGAQRLLPALQQAYFNWSQLKGFSSELSDILTFLNRPMKRQLTGIKPLPFLESITLNKVHFRYHTDQSLVLNNVNLKICRGDRVGIIGATGSGKSTLLDILMGLLAPTSGSMYVDGQDVCDPSMPEMMTEWRANIAHVPQSIYLSDSTIAENIAFGVPKREIDMNKVIEASQLAKIASFIDSTSDGYGSFVGERGISLSGGQRQRIGIARALYKQAKFLVFDEATSALDNATESALMDSIQLLSSDLTIVSIAHRLSTLRQCNKVYEIKNGNIFELPKSRFS